MTLIETPTTKWGDLDDPNYGTVTAEGSDWNFEFTVNTQLTRVDFYRNGKHEFSLIRWIYKDNQIGFDRQRENTAERTWSNNLIPGELLAAGINILYNRELVPDARSHSD